MAYFFRIAASSSWCITCELYISSKCWVLLRLTVSLCVYVCVSIMEAAWQRGAVRVVLWFTVSRVPVSRQAGSSGSCTPALSPYIRLTGQAAERPAGQTGGSQARAGCASAYPWNKNSMLSSRLSLPVMSECFIDKRVTPSAWINCQDSHLRLKMWRGTLLGRCWSVLGKSAARLSKFGIFFGTICFKRTQSLLLYFGTLAMSKSLLQFLVNGKMKSRIIGYLRLLLLLPFYQKGITM